MYLKQEEFNAIALYVMLTCGQAIEDNPLVREEDVDSLIAILKTLEDRQKKTNTKTWAIIKEKRKENPMYGRSKLEASLHKQAQEKRRNKGLK